MVNEIRHTSQADVEAMMGLDVSKAEVPKTVDTPAEDDVMEMPPDSDEQDEAQMRAAAEARQVEAAINAQDHGDEARAEAILKGLDVDDEPIALPDDSE